MKGIATNGFEYEISETVFENMELIDALAEAGEENPLAISNVCLLVFGKEQRNRLYDSLRLEDGTVPFMEVANVISEIFAERGKEGKN